MVNLAGVKFPCFEYGGKTKSDMLLSFRNSVWTAMPLKPVTEKQDGTGDLLPVYVWSVWKRPRLRSQKSDYVYVPCSPGLICCHENHQNPFLLYLVQQSRDFHWRKGIIYKELSLRNDQNIYCKGYRIPGLGPHIFSACWWIWRPEFAHLDFSDSGYRDQFPESRQRWLRKSA